MKCYITTLYVHYVTATCGSSSSGDWYYNNVTDNCFFVSRAPDMWDPAELSCRGLNSHLATVEKDDHLFLSKIISRHGLADTNYWIGLRMVNPALLTYSWVDGNLGNVYRQWDKNEPDPRGVQDCVVMNSRTGKYRDDYCMRPTGYRFICMKAKEDLTPPATTVAPEVYEKWGCPITCQNCVMFRKYTVKLFVNEKLRVKMETFQKACSNKQ